MILILIFFILACHTMGLMFLKYECNENTSPHNLCITWEPHKLILNRCGDRTCTIPHEYGSDGYCEDKKRYPGEYCDSNNQCHEGNKCKGYVCRGRKVGEFCNSHINCDVELYCNNKRCTEPTNTCDKNKLCKSNEVCDNGKCVVMAQLENGANAFVPAACKSYYLVGNKCHEGPKLNPNTNSKESFCKYKIGNNIINGSKICKIGRAHV